VSPAWLSQRLIFLKKVVHILEDLAYIEVISLRIERRKVKLCLLI